MPSDEAKRAAFETIAGRAGAFRSAVSVTADQLRGYLADHRASTGGTEAAASSLGQFATGRINFERFAALSSAAPDHGHDWTIPVTRALDALSELEELGDETFHVRVPPEGDLLQAVDGALARAGRAFAAARLAALARSSSYAGHEHDPLLGPFPFRMWSQAERRIAPPLVVEVAGGDLMAPGLAAYLDGSQWILLLVDGPAPPAPLARLISPGVLVQQTAGLDEVRIPTGSPMPAVIAVLPGESARFLNSPTGTGAASLQITNMPAGEPRRAIGRVSAFQQQQDLAVLAAASRGPATEAPEPAPPGEAVTSAPRPDAGAAPSPIPPSTDPVDSLASWLLSQVDLEGLDQHES